MVRKYPSKHVEDWQEVRVVEMYKKDRLIKDIMVSTCLSRNLVTKILDAHEIRKPYKPAESENRAQEIEKGTIIQQCVTGASENHKKITSLFLVSSSELLA